MTTSSSSFFLVASTTLALGTCLTRPAFAETPLPAPAVPSAPAASAVSAPPAAPAPTPALPPASASPASPASPAMAPPPLPAPPSTGGFVPPFPYEATASCTLTEAFGVVVSDARTAAVLVCGELANIPGATFRLRLGTLGPKLVLTAYRETPQGVHDQRQAILSGIDEAPAAAQRIAMAFAEGKAISETATTDTVLATEGVAPKVKAGRVGVDLGVGMTSALGFSASPSGGVYVAVRYEAQRFAIGASARWAGIGSAERKYFGGSLDVGGRINLADGGVAPFLGGGVGFASFNMSQQGTVHQVAPNTETTTGGTSLEGSGMALYVEAGLQVLRLDRVSWNIGLRVDIPVFSMKDIHADERFYGVPTAITTGLTFR